MLQLPFPQPRRGGSRFYVTAAPAGLESVETNCETELLIFQGLAPWLLTAAPLGLRNQGNRKVISSAFLTPGWGPAALQAAKHVPGFHPGLGPGGPSGRNGLCVLMSL